MTTSCQGFSILLLRQQEFQFNRSPAHFHETNIAVFEFSKIEAFFESLLNLINFSSKGSFQIFHPVRQSISQTTLVLNFKQGLSSTLLNNRSFVALVDW